MTWDADDTCAAVLSEGAFVMGTTSTSNPLPGVSPWSMITAS